MDYQKEIAAMTPGDKVEGFYVLTDAMIKVSNHNKPFLAAALSDRSGTISAKMWDYSGTIGSQDVGKIVFVRCQVSEYRGDLQVVLDLIRLRLPGDTVNPDWLVPLAPIDPDQALDEIRQLVDTISDPDYQSIALTMLDRHEQELRTIPAAKSVHHSFVGGLLLHTLNMLRMADFLADQYIEIIDRNLLLTGTLLHDFAKSREFELSDLGLVTSYSVPGQLIGHLVMGAQEVADLAREANMPEEKSILLQHLILSHHGQPDFGAAVRPLCAEGELLYLIDYLDSRMQIFQETLKTIPEGTFTDRVFALDNRRIYRHAFSDNVQQP